MGKKLAVSLLVVAALLLPSFASNAVQTVRDIAGQPASNPAPANHNTSSSLLDRIDMASVHADDGLNLSDAGAAVSMAPPAPRCRLGAWASPESVGVVRRGGYVHVNDVADAQRFFPGLQGTGVLRGLRCPSLACMEDLADQLRARNIPFDAFCYDLEGWDQTPLWEREHQVEATRMARQLADRYGVKLVMGPARAFTWRNWPQMAPYAHMWVIQAQAGQRNYTPAQFATWLSTYVDLLDTNPTMPVWAQVSTVPEEQLTLAQYMAYVDAVKPSLVDGVYVFNPRSNLPLQAIWNAECGQ